MLCIIKYLIFSLIFPLFCLEFLESSIRKINGNLTEAWRLSQNFSKSASLVFFLVFSGQCSSTLVQGRNSSHVTPKDKLL